MERKDHRWDDYSKTALVARVRSLEERIDQLNAVLEVASGSIKSFVEAPWYARFWRALRGRVS
jgi:hypothetical protein